MTRQIIKQPNGKFAVYSTIVDGFVLCNATEEDLVKHAGETARQEAEAETQRLINEVKAGNKPYYQFTLTWDQASKNNNRAYAPVVLD